MAVKKVFKKSVFCKSLRKFKLKSCKLIGIKSQYDQVLKRVISNSKLISLKLPEISLDFDLCVQLAEGLKENKTITRLRF